MQLCPIIAGASRHPPSAVLGSKNRFNSCRSARVAAFGFFGFQHWVQFLQKRCGFRLRLFGVPKMSQASSWEGQCSRTLFCYSFWEPFGILHSRYLRQLRPAKWCQHVLLKGSLPRAPGNQFLQNSNLALAFGEDHYHLPW